MPTPKSSNGNMMFLSQTKAGFVQRVNEDTPNAKPRVITTGPNTGKTIYELEFSSIIGYLSDVKYHKNEDKEYGPSWAFLIQEQTGPVNLQYSADSFTVQSLLEVLPRIDLSKEVQLIAWSKNDHMRLSVKQQNAAGEWEWVENIYKEWIDQKIKYKNGYPAAPKNADKEDLEIHFKMVQKFLRNNTMMWIENVLTPYKLKAEQQEIDMSMSQPAKHAEPIVDPNYGGGYKREANFTSPNPDMDDLPF